MPPNIACDRCGGRAAFELQTKADASYPAFQIFMCQGCGRVQWQKVQVQQQQQPPPKKDGPS